MAAVPSSLCPRWRSHFHFVADAGGRTLFRSPPGAASADVSLSRHPDTRQPASRLAAAWLTRTGVVPCGEHILCWTPAMLTTIAIGMSVSKLSGSAALKLGVCELL